LKNKSHIFVRFIYYPYSHTHIVSRKAIIHLPKSKFLRRHIVTTDSELVKYINPPQNKRKSKDDFIVLVRVWVHSFENFTFRFLIIFLSWLPIKFKFENESRKPTDPNLKPTPLACSNCLIKRWYIYIYIAFRSCIYKGTDH